MLGINFIKFPPTTHVFHFKGGELKRQGRGLSFFYFGPFSTIVAVKETEPGVKSVLLTIRWKDGEKSAKLELLRADTGGSSLW